jgi:hypothetical protein
MPAIQEECKSQRLVKSLAFIAVLKKVRYALCPMPYAHGGLCPMPSRTSYESSKGYTTPLS